MSRRTLPFLYLNLSGEMMYIIEERLQAQHVDKDKSTKVLNDLITLIFNGKILDEVLKPQELHSKEALETIFENIANATSMRVEKGSMQRMYSIMVMAVKYQLHQTGSPQDLLGITLNHMDAMHNMLQGTTRAFLLMDRAYDLIFKAFASTSVMEMALIRQTLLTFFQDRQSKVRKYISAGHQNSLTGRFSLPREGALSYGVKMPVRIRLMGPNGGLSTETAFSDPDTNYHEMTNVISWAQDLKQHETRGTKLGMNFLKFGEIDTGVQEDQKSDLSASNNDHKLNTRPMSRQEMSLIRTVQTSSRGIERKTSFNLQLGRGTGAQHAHLMLPGAKLPPGGRGGKIVLPKINNKLPIRPLDGGTPMIKSTHNTPVNGRKPTTGTRRSKEVRW